MHDLIEDFLADVKASKAQATYSNRKSDLKRYQQWLEHEELELTEVGHKDVHRFLRNQAQEFSDATVKSRYTSVKLLYDFLVGIWDEMEKSPVEDLKRSDYTGNGDGKKHQKADVVYVTPDEMDAMVEHAPNPSLRNELLLRLLWQTGLRRGELAIIEIENIDRDVRAIEVWSPKTKEWRTVFYQPSLDFLMNQWLDSGYRGSYMSAADSPYLFVSKRAEQLSSHAVNEIVKKAAENAEIQDVMYEDGGGQKRHRITAHAIRHGHAVQALKSGIDIRTVQKHMGHSDIETTMKYLRLIDDDVRESYRKFGSRPPDAEA